MEPHENQLSSYFHHQHHHQHHHQSPTTSPTNGLLPHTNHLSSADAAAPHIVYPHSVPSATVSSSPLEPARRKRGRPRKYGTPEEALAAKKASTASSHSSSSKARKDLASPSSLNAVSASSSFSAPSNKSQFPAHDVGNAGQGFAPHVINVAAGEDVGQKIMLFMQQCKQEICILSASGSVSNASLRQPASSGGNISYEGRFEIVSLCGSYVRTDIGGKTGGLSVCLSSSNGHIIGGGVGGPLKAAGPVQVIVGTFVIDPKKEVGGGLKEKGDASASKLASPIGGTPMSNLRYGSNIDLGGNQVRGIDEHQGIGESHFLLQPRGPQQDWRMGLDATNTAYDFTGRTGRHHSPENGDYDQIPD